jgi:hypothetical protein
MSTASGYSLDLYCDIAEDDASATNGNGHESIRHRFKLNTAYVQYVGETWSETAGKAKRDGWIISRDKQHAYCPYCAREGKVPKRYRPRKKLSR